MLTKEFLEESNNFFDSVANVLEEEFPGEDIRAVMFHTDTWANLREEDAATALVIRFDFADKKPVNFLGRFSTYLRSKGIVPVNSHHLYISGNRILMQPR